MDTEIIHCNLKIFLDGIMFLIVADQHRPTIWRKEQQCCHTEYTSNDGDQATSMINLKIMSHKWIIQQMDFFIKLKISSKMSLSLNICQLLALIYNIF